MAAELRLSISFGIYTKTTFQQWMRNLLTESSNLNTDGCLFYEKRVSGRAYMHEQTNRSKVT